MKKSKFAYLLVFMLSLNINVAKADTDNIVCRLDSIINTDNKIHYTYHTNGHLRSKTTLQGIWEYDEKGRIIAANYNENEENVQETYRYNAHDSLVYFFGEIHNDKFETWGTHTICYEYDRDNRLTLFSEEYLESGSWSITHNESYSESYTYDSNGIITYHGTNSTEQNGSLYSISSTNTYYENGHVISIENRQEHRDNPEGETNIERIMTEYKYDNNWILTNEIHYYNNGWDDNLDVHEEIHYSYDSQGRCICALTFTPFDGEMTETTKVDSIYKDNVITVNTYEMSWGDWKLISSQITEKIYDSNGQIICENHFTNSIKDSYVTWAYDTNGRLLSHKEYKLKNSIFNLTFLESWTYDSSDNIICYIKNYDKTEYKYDENSLKIEEKRYRRYSGDIENWDLYCTYTWQNNDLISVVTTNSKRLYEYDSLHNLIKSEDYSWNTPGNTWEMTQRIKYYYDTSIDKSNIQMPDDIDGIQHNSKLLYYVTYLKLGSYKTTYYYGQPNIEEPVEPSATIELVDGETYNEGTTQENKEISYTRTFNNTKWQALYIPFSMSYEDWKDDFEVAFINSVRQYDNDEDGIVDETIMDIMKIKNGSLIPNTPYLIKAKNTGEKTITMNNATLYQAEKNSIECSTMLAKYTFTGTYSTIPASTMSANNYYAMGGGSLIMTDGTSDLKPFRWYLNIESRSPMYSVSSAAKTITINVVGEEEATGISQMSSDREHSSAIYDLNGRKMSQKNLKSGLYIKNGKKIIIK